MNKLPKYPAYKPSGVEWLGEIPEHWDVKKLKVITSFINRGVTPNYVESSNYKVINQATFSKGYFDLLNIKFTNDKYFSGLNFSKGIVEKNDILLASTGGGVLGKVAFVDFDDKTFQADSHVTLIRGAKPEFMSKYYYYILSISFDLINGLLAQGSTNQTELQRDWLRNYKFPVPLFSEQTAIAAFLDHKTSQIDQAIGIKEKQIEPLKERRQILIHRAVTRGLNPNVKLKESGVEWIGEIPEHWEVKKIKHVSTKIGSGVTPSGGGTTYLDSGIPLLRSQNILFGKIELEGVAYISDKTHSSMSNSQVRKGDVLLNITGGSIGRCHFVDFDIPLNVNQHVCIVRPSTSIASIFLNSLIASEVGQGQIWFFQQGGGREGLNFQAIKNFLIPLPPKSEQSEISKYIETITSKFLTAISLKEQEIEKLKEYKASLIDAAVTGKIMVG
jgi:type I restriction enzyme S subunit